MDRTRTVRGNGIAMGFSALALLALLATLVALAALAAADGPDDTDAGGNVSQAKALGPGSWEGGIMRNATRADTADFFSVAFEGGRPVSFRATVLSSSSTHQEVHLRVLDLTGTEVVALSFPDAGTPVDYATLTNEEEDSPFYYVGITWDGSSIPDFVIDYSLVVDIGNWSQNDTATGGDVDNTHEGAHRLDAGDHTGAVGGVEPSWGRDANADGTDMYVVSPEPELFLKLTVTLDGGRTDRGSALVVTLENTTGVALDKIVVSEFGRPTVMRYFPLTLAEVFVNVSTTAVHLNYTVTVATVEPGADAGKRADAGEDADHAMEVDADTMSGVIMRGYNAEDAADFFELELEGSAFVEAWLTLRSGTADTSNVRFHIFDTSKSEVVNFTFSGLDEPRRFASLTNSELPTLRYYFAVTWRGDGRDFEFRYDLVTSVGSRQNDKGTGKDLTNRTSAAPGLDLDTTVGGTIGGSLPKWGHDINADGADAYEVYPVVDQYLVVEASLVAFGGERRTGFDVELFDQSGKSLGIESVFSVGESLELRYFTPTSQPLYVVVESESEMCDYTIRVTMEAPPSIDLFVGDVSLTPSKPTTGTSVTITATLRSSTAAMPSELIRVEVYAGGDLIDSRDVIFEGATEVVQTFSWKAIYGQTTISVRMDTLNAIPFETDEANNERSITADVRDEGQNGNGDGDDGGLPTWVWVAVLIVIIVVAIAIAVGLVFTRGHGAEDEEPED
jgi:hypothetical protein